MPYKDKNKAREYNTKYKKEFRKKNPDIVKEKARIRYKNNTDKILDTARKWRKKNPESVQKIRKRSYRNNIEYMKNKTRRLHILQNYNLTLNDFDVLLNSQDNKCAICESKEPKGKGNFHIDHDHQTGKVRGLLCHKCNTGIGLLNDDIALLNKALQYLEKHKELSP